MKNHVIGISILVCVYGYGLSFEWNEMFKLMELDSEATNGGGVLWWQRWNGNPYHCQEE